jgi:hypothetical protein
VVAGRRCGKTRYAAIDLGMKALKCTDPLARVLYIAPTQAMADDLMWDLMKHLFEPVIEKTNINDSDITFVNGVVVQLRGADKPDRLRGKKVFHAVLDEMKDMKDSVWEENVAPSLSDMEGSALFIGTPAPGESVFRSLYEMGLEDNPEWASWHLTTADNEMISKMEIESARKRLSSMVFEREYNASFDSMSQDIFKSEWLLFGKEPEDGDWYMAIDPAGFEAVAAGDNKKKHLDNCAIAVVKVCDDGRWFVKKIEYGRWDVREASTRILKNIKDVRPLMVGIEKGSLMRALLPYLSDQMRKFNQYAHIEPIPTSGSNKVSRITYNLQGMFEHGRITLNERENWDQFKKEYVNFPARGAHDDLLDSLSMVTNLAQTSYARRQDDEEPEVLDEICGF